ncbi:hypothetical protein CSV79_16000 [Sporosarcina sp. P13]|uniref:hypothetical protein n=1 Tax=Sporosarcina sp. P13 TaxID=2048263 RepID=UPI000C165415|nr:hypothetical protein [Sporosarcina sp. P13]PIC62634.1 hypothetical protein CSV79_16000 [Sporosarcina sp. P13]
MRIFLHECKKALTSPILIALLIVFSAFNIFIIVSSSDHKEELKMVNEIIDRYGREITDDSLKQFQKDIQNDLLELKGITGQQFDSVYVFLDGLRFEEQEQYSDKDWEFINSLQLKEMYFSMANSIDESYAEIDVVAGGQGDLKRYGIGGKAAETYSEENEEFAERFKEMVNNEEHKEWFFAGKSYFMHSFLFKTVFLHIIIESLLLIVLMTALITTYEFENRTQLLTYSTRRGRKLMKDKLAASLAVSTVISLLLFTITLGTYFFLFDYSHVWETSISSAFNWEYNFPNVTWWDLSVGEFLIGVLVLVFIIQLLFSGLTFALSVIVKSSYITFFLFATLFVLGWLLPTFMPKSSNLLFVSSYTLSTLTMAISQSFMGSNGLILFKNFEWMTISCWMVITIVFCAITYKYFRKMDIQ